MDVSRELPQFYNIYEQPWRRRSTEHEVVHGLETRLLSTDSRTGSATYMAEIPAGWKRTLSTEYHAVELFVMKGDFTVNGQSMGASGFAGIPHWCGPAEVSSHAGAVVYFFVNPPLKLPAYEKGVHVKKVWQEPWLPAEMTDVRHGIMFKSLRVPDPAAGAIHGSESGYLRTTLMSPGFVEPREEVHHLSWEEIIILSGDMLMGGRGLHTGGTFLGNPANLWHYPAATLRGCLLLIHTDAEQDVEFRNYAGGFPEMTAYLDGADWLEQPEHTPADDGWEPSWWKGETAAGVAGVQVPPKHEGGSSVQGQLPSGSQSVAAPQTQAKATE